MEDREAIINPNKDYCSDCGEVIDDASPWGASEPLCKQCYFQRKYNGEEEL